jgi:hypothetical protein
MQRRAMDYSGPVGIEILLNGDSGFTPDDAEALTRRLEPHFQHHFRASAAVVQGDNALPPQLPPTDIVLQIGEYMLAQLDDLAIAFLSDLLLRAFESRRRRRDGILEIRWVEEVERPGRRTKGRVRGPAHSADAIKELYERACDQRARGAVNDDD